MRDLGDRDVFHSVRQWLRPSKHERLSRRLRAEEPRRTGPVSVLSLHSDILISSSADVIAVRKEARDLSERSGFLGAEATLVATAASELARIVADPDLPGKIELYIVQETTKTGLIVAAHLNATQTTRLDLPHVRQLIQIMTEMDGVDVLYQSSERILTMKKWRRGLPAKLEQVHSA
jgi:hypothetical protein